MAVTTRLGLIEYCLRALGEPVVEINIDEQQVEDRVDEANNNINPVFKIDTASADAYLTQAYNHLLLTDYYKNAISLI